MQTISYSWLVWLSYIALEILTAPVTDAFCYRSAGTAKSIHYFLATSDAIESNSVSIGETTDNLRWDIL